MAKIKSRKSNLFINIILVAVIVYLSYVCINLGVRIKNVDNQNIELDAKMSIEKDKNEQLQSTHDAPMDEEYAEKVAREHGYASTDEKVYQIK